MADIKTHFIDISSGCDWVLTDAGLEEDEGLETAVIISLFTDARAAETDKLPGGSTDPRGWWGDSFPEVEGDSDGSLLWLVMSSKQLDENLLRAKGYAEAALQWLVDDGVASRVEVVASNTRDGLLALAVSIYRTGDANPALFRFETQWSAMQ